MTTTASTTPELADRLAHLHTRGAAGQTSFVVRDGPLKTDSPPVVSECWDEEGSDEELSDEEPSVLEGLDASLNPQGTLIISGLAFRLYLHSLVLSPEPQLQQLADLPSPEPLTGGKTDQTVTAIWASDSSAVLLQYTIRDFSDARTEFNENSFFEVLYLLDTASQELKHITTNYDILLMQTAYFSPDTTTIVVVWMEFDDDTWRCDVHTRTSMSCDRIACLRLRRLRSLTPPSSAFLSTSRWVAASARGFEVWHLPSGQLEGGRTLSHTGDAQAQPRSGLVAVSPDGTRLAFLPADCSDAYLYDVATLDAVGVVQLGDVLQSDREACSLSWGPISWLLTGPQCLQAFRQQAGSTLSAEVLRQESQAAQASACSPEGAFVAVVASASDGASLQVYDLQSGQVVLTQAVSLQASFQAEPESCQRRMAVWWSSSGFELVVRITAEEDGRAMDQVTVFHI